MKDNSKYSLLLLFTFCCLIGCTHPGDVTLNVQQASHEVIIKDMQFVPSELYISNGDVVVFTNNDMVTHDVTEEKDRKWSSAPLAPQKSWRKSFTESADYLCTLHPVMKGKIIIR